MVTSYDNGHEIEYANDQWVYSDTKEPLINSRTCVFCGELPNQQGHDACLGRLGNVINACCGHGKHEGYIMFDNGITIRGYFTIEKD